MLPREFPIVHGTEEAQRAMTSGKTMGPDDLPAEFPQTYIGRGVFRNFAQRSKHHHYRVEKQDRGYASVDSIHLPSDRTAHRYRLRSVETGVRVCLP